MMNVNQAILLLMLHVLVIPKQKIFCLATLNGDLKYLANRGYIKDIHMRLEEPDEEEDELDDELLEVEVTLTDKGVAWVRAALSLKVEKKEIFVVNLPPVPEQ